MNSIYKETAFPYIVEVKTFSDKRGLLQSLNLSQIPFVVKRVFSISPYTRQTVRGGHAHKTCWQAMVPSNSNLIVEGKNKDGDFRFNLQPGDLLIIPPWNWLKILFEEVGTTASVFCSHNYDVDDYIFSQPW
jgi:hypothetical protein